MALIGLGMMGRRMASNMATHQGFDIVAGWDPDPVACDKARSETPALEIGESAHDIIGDPGIDLVYVASPPHFHEPHAMAAIEAGKAVFCEKPLGVDVAISRNLVEAAEARGTANAVNFPFAAAPAVRFMKSQLDTGTPGRIMGADILLHFSQWPRPWQMGAASWLDRRPQGGFIREVLSHFVFLIERLFGPAALESKAVFYPEGEGSEDRMVSVITCGGVRVSVAGSTGGVGPDRVEFTLWGSDRSFRLFDWYWLQSSAGDGWEAELKELTDPRRASYLGTLDDLQALLDGKPNTVATFRDAYSVQTLIEAILST